MKTLILSICLLAALTGRAQNIWSVNGGFSSTGTTDLTLQTNGTTRVTLLNSNGYVGIGTTPTEFLDINGTARFRTIPQNNGLTQVLVSDATGKVFWRDAASITGGVVALPYVILSSTLGIGNSTLSVNTAYDNTGVGYQALAANTSGAPNAAFGSMSLHANTVGSNNTAMGGSSLYSNTTGSSNTAIGASSLYSNTTGSVNTAFGASSLHNNTTGAYNTAFGYALYSNTLGNGNCATGHFSLYGNTTGSYNSAYGYNTLYWNSTGNYNSAFGDYAGSNNNYDNTTSIGYNATPTASNQVRLGNTSVTSIGGQVSWTTLSDGRFKTDIREDVSGLAFIEALRPISYSIDKDKLDSFLGLSEKVRIPSSGPSAQPMRQTGFVAQEVENVIKKSGFVFHGVEAPQNDKDHYSIRYAEFVVPLVKAVQELSAKVEQQQKTIDMLINQRKGTVLNGHDELVSSTATLFQNSPNPFSSDTEIRMALPENVSNATLMVYTMDGVQLKAIPVRGSGNTSVKISAHELSAGVYVYALVVNGSTTDVKRMILTK